MTEKRISYGPIGNGKRKPLYVILLNIFVVCLIVYQSIIITTRINRSTVGSLLTYINDLISMFFLLIWLNISVRVGALLYSFSFICYLAIQFFFVPTRPTGIIVSCILRFIAVGCLASSWRKETLKRKINQAIKD